MPSASLKSEYRRQLQASFDTFGPQLGIQIRVPVKDFEELAAGQPKYMNRVDRRPGSDPTHVLLRQYQLEEILDYEPGKPDQSDNTASLPGPRRAKLAG